MSRWNNGENKEEVMKTIRSILALGALMLPVVMLTGCGGEESGKTIANVHDKKTQQGEVASQETSVTNRPFSSAEELVGKTLASMGIPVGLDSDKKRVTTVGTWSWSLKKQDDPDSSFDFKFDFPDEENDDFETRRFKAAWKAYASGLANMAMSIVPEKKREDVTTDNAKEVVKTTTNGIEMKARIVLEGVATVTSAESYDAAADEVQFAVAVCRSEKRRRLYEDYKAGRKPNSPGRYSLKEWINQNSGIGVLCPRSIIDNDGILWRAAGLSVEVDGRKEESIKNAIEKAKCYAFEAAIRTIMVEVSFSKTAETTMEVNGSTTVSKLQDTTKIIPCCKVAQSDSSRVRWFDIGRKSHITGKRTRLIVCAIRE